MKKKFLPLIVFLFIISIVNASEAVTRQDVESIMVSLIHGEERNMPNLMPVSLPSANATKQEAQQANDVTIEHKKLETDPYSYEIPKSNTTEQKPKINVIKIPHFGEDGKVEDDTQNEVAPEHEQLESEKVLYPSKPHEETTIEQKPKINVIKIPHFDTDLGEKKEEKEEQTETEYTIPTILTPGTGIQDSQNEICNTSPEQIPQQKPVQSLTRQEVFLTCLTKMGWANTLKLLEQLIIFEEYSNFSPVDFIRTNMTPAPPANLFTPANEIFPNEDLMKLKKWTMSCVRNVQLETKLTVNGNSLCLIKRGVPTPSGYMQDMKTKNVPLFITSAVKY